jgi:hypothetical protein
MLVKVKGKKAMSMCMIHVLAMKASMTVEYSLPNKNYYNEMNAYLAPGA